MNSRRSFFKRIGQAAAIVALAPQLAFRAKPLEIRATEYTANSLGIYAQMGDYVPIVLPFDEGCSLTRATFAPITPEHFAAAFATESGFRESFFGERGNSALEHLVNAQEAV